MKHKVIVEGVVAEKRYDAFIFNYYSSAYFDICIENSMTKEILDKEKKDNMWLEDYRNGDVWITPRYKKAGNKIIWNGELDCPVMKAGETLRINDFNQEFEIEKVIRDTDNNYVYQTNTVVEISNKENEDSMKIEAISKYEEWKKKNEKRKKKAEEDEQKFKEEISKLRGNRKNWFTRLFK